MKASSSIMARAGVSTALAVILLYLASIVPSGRLALMCAASIGVIFLRMRCGMKTALLCYVASAVLSLVLLPEKGVSLVYILFLGYYPLIKLSTERLGNRIARWLIRLAVFNIAFAVMFRMAMALFDVWLGMFSGSCLVLTLAGNVAFIVYDFALTQVILIYLRKFDGRM